jgi:hypothetical protein
VPRIPQSRWQEKDISFLASLFSFIIILPQKALKQLAK